MQADVLLGRVEQLRHGRLGQPNRALRGAELDLRSPILGGVENQFAPAGMGLGIGAVYHLVIR